MLLLTINDENFEVRKTAIKICGRLSLMNPAYIVPPLRRLLLQLMTTLDYGGQSSRKKEETATSLTILIASTGDLTKPYVTQIMEVLIPKAKDPSPAVSAAIITAIGEMCVVGGQDMVPFIDKLMPILVETLQDQSLTFKRDAAVKALGQLAGSSGYVIQPLLDYPKLLGLLVGILKSDATHSIRIEVVKLLGILGALDPYKHKEVERSGQDADTVAQQNAPSIDMELLMKGKSPTHDDYFPTVVMKILLKIAKDPSLINHHPAVIQSIMHIYKTLGIKCLQYLDDVIGGFDSIMHLCPPSMLETYFLHLGDLVKIVKTNIRLQLPQIFTLIREFFPNSNLQITIIGVIEKIYKAMEKEFRLHL
ncbi:unnamed protein product [Ambrosiozyma monospora]|uniref:Unnamed protein product n=1 Tax=Ambrosiozyma monospora TaxID=43982 RepID=A0ACB5TG46_AMBMO|nr:unnamed protein product [Ambrosiozyma monospora]